MKVGVDTSGNSGKFLLDTSLAGNSNAGHSFEDGARGNGVIGRLLTDEERWALVEYMKSLPNEPRQIAPMGGPAEPTPCVVGSRPSSTSRILGPTTVPPNFPKCLA